MAIEFIRKLLGYMCADGTPGFADNDARASAAIAANLLELLDVDQAVELKGDSIDVSFTELVVQHLQASLPGKAPTRNWIFPGAMEHPSIDEYLQYRHLRELKQLVLSDTTGLLREEMPRSLTTTPDITIGLGTGQELPFLHAAIWCTWRVDPCKRLAISEGAVLLNKHRRGRQPHIVVVTAEPLPSNIAQIDQGLGRVDVAYHAALEELKQAVAHKEATEECAILKILVEQERIKDLSRLADDLAR